MTSREPGGGSPEPTPAPARRGAVRRAVPATSATARSPAHRRAAGGSRRRRERLDRAARRRQRRHRQRPRSLAERVLLGEGGELGDEPIGVAGGEPLLGPRLAAWTRSSSSRVASVRPSSTSANSGYAGPRQCCQDRVEGLPCRRPSRRRRGTLRRAGRRRARSLTAPGDSRWPSTRRPRRAGHGGGGRGGSAAPPRGRAGRPAGHSASIAASGATTCPRCTTSNASRRRCNVPSGVMSHPSSSRTRIGPSTSTRNGLAPLARIRSHRNPATHGSLESARRTPPPVVRSNRTRAAGTTHGRISSGPDLLAYPFATHSYTHRVRICRQFPAA